MKPYGLNELREMYLKFFESKGHLRMSSFSLVPHNDNSLLLINAGMCPLKPYFTRKEVPPRNRVTTCQKCVRTGDIENVGKTDRHGTFFEMLGNFSFGDYFKVEAITWSWEFLTKVLEMDPNRLYPSIFAEDEEAFEIWNKVIGIPEDRIFRFGREADGTSDNFWEHGAGPCGPCSEIYYDRGESYGCGKPDCKVGCDCDRYMEIWNNVFTQFDGDGHGNYELLETKNIDTGMGLERLAAVVQGVDSIFDVDTIQALRNKVCELTNTVYNQKHETDVSIRLITDHIRSATFMISDGIMPSNEGRGYVLRRIIRRAARHGRLLEVKNAFLAELSETVIETSKDGYPELEEKKNMIFKVLTEEENKFNKTIDQGLSILSSMMEEDAATKVLSGEKAFKLYDTYGFPLDLTKEILEEKQYTVDEAGFKAAMEIQRKTARNARKESDYMGNEATVYETLNADITTEFIGYDRLENDTVITAMARIDGDETIISEALSEGDRGTIIVPATSFYATMGGQAADTGIIEGKEAVFRVTDTVKLVGNRVGHIGVVEKGMFSVSDKVSMKVDADYRNAIMKNHSATHLLQKALRIVLGDHVEQAGSLVTNDRLRFDFTHFQALTKEEINEVEKIVNDEITNNLSIVTQVMSIDEARKTGAMALFGEKYGENVRVVAMGDFSKEFCGGTHAPNTGCIKLFKILTETGIAAGVRRIEALTADNVINYYNKLEDEISRIATAAKTDNSMIINKIEAMQDEIKQLSSENERLKNKLAKDSMGDVMGNVVTVKNVKFLPVNVENIEMNELRTLSDQLKEKVGSGVIAIASVCGSDKVNLLVTVTDDLVKAGYNAGKFVKESASFIEGSGGGRPNMAQAGGKKPAGIQDTFNKIQELI